MLGGWKSNVIESICDRLSKSIEVVVRWIILINSDLLIRSLSYTHDTYSRSR